MRISSSTGRWTVRRSAAVLASVGLAMLGVVASAGPAQAAPALVAYVSPPYVQGPNVSSTSGIQLENFDIDCPDTWWAGSGNEGTMTGTCRSMNPDYWGGASSESGLPFVGDGSTVTKYGAIFAGETLTVTLDHPVSYMGFEWFAGDSSNFLTLYDGDTEVATFTTDDLLAMIYYNNMGSWSTEDYMIHPGYNQWMGAPSAYVHLVGTDGLTFNKFTMTQPYYGGFEFDNFALSDDPVTVDPTKVVAITDQVPPDANGDGVSDITEDSDGDGIADPFEDNNGDGVSDVLQDSDGDGTSDYAEEVMLPDTGVPAWSLLWTAGALVTAGGAILVIRRRAH